MSTRKRRKDEAKYPTEDGTLYTCSLEGDEAVVELLSSRKTSLANSHEYFVRVVGKDRRLDGWVAQENISIEGVEEAPKTYKRKVSKTDPLYVFSHYDGVATDEAAALHTSKLKEVKWIERVVYGSHVIDAWYPSSFPKKHLKEEVMQNSGTLFIDELTLKYTGNALRMVELNQSHGEGVFCVRSPPGICLYDHDNWALWEVDGGEGPEYNNDVAENAVNTNVTMHRALEAASRELYCQNLSFLSKLFLDHKQECYTTSNFIFFVLTEKVPREDSAITGKSHDSRTGRPAIGGHDYMFRGYFSREKAQRDNNLSCIMVLPPWQRSGIGRMLIHFSYLLSGREPRFKKTIGAGSPERPLSDLGKKVYLQYWQHQVLCFLSEWKAVGAPGTVADLVCHTHIERRDALKALHSLGYLIEPDTNPEIDWDRVDLEIVSQTKAVGPQIDESKLRHVGLAFGAGDDDDAYEV